MLIITVLNYNFYKLMDKNSQLLKEFCSDLKKKKKKKKSKEIKN